MQPVAYLVKHSVPNYLSNLPIPDSIGGWLRLGFRDWLALIPPTAAAAGFTYMTYRAFCPHGRPAKCGRINPMINLKSEKVVDIIDVEDIEEKAKFCRCWRSKKWPYCDGAHGPYNREYGDNTGILLVKRKTPKSSK